MLLRFNDVALHYKRLSDPKPPHIYDIYIINYRIIRTRHIACVWAEELRARTLFFPPMILLLPIGGYCSHADGERVRAFKEAYPVFVEDPRNLILGGCADGVSPFDKAAKNISMLCFVFTVFNLPQQIRDKYPNLILWGIFSGLHMKHVEVHKFLTEDLKFVSKGFTVYDSSDGKTFQCTAKPIALIADTPGYGDFSQQKGVGASAGCYKCTMSGCHCAALSHNLYADRLQEVALAGMPVELRTHDSLVMQREEVEVSTHPPLQLYADFYQTCSFHREVTAM